MKLELHVSVWHSFKIGGQLRGTKASANGNEYCIGLVERVQILSFKSI
jgi:hypothetical protein